MTKFLEQRLIGAREWVKECPDNPLAQKNLQEVLTLEELSLVSGAGPTGIGFHTCPVQKSGG